MLDILRQRELSSCSESRVRRCLSSNVQLLQRMELQSKLQGHFGCVNTVSFDTEGGDVLISGSDDQKIIIWDWQAGIKRLTFDSGHHNNVFQARMIPHCSGTRIVTCAADGQVRLVEIPEGASSQNVQTSMLGQHGGRAHKLALDPLNPGQCFYSCGEDEQVMHYDLRCVAGTQQNGSSSSSSRNSGRRKLLICRGYSHTKGPSSKGIGLNAIHCNPARPWQFAVGGSDSWARVYDCRRTRDTSASVGAPTREQARDNSLYSLSDEPVARLCPKHMWRLEGSGSFGGDANITCVMFSKQGELVATYNDEDIYLFSPEAASGCLGSSSSSSSDQNPDQNLQQQQQQSRRARHGGVNSSSSGSMQRLSPSRRRRENLESDTTAAAAANSSSDGDLGRRAEQQQQQQRRAAAAAEDEQRPRWRRRQLLHTESAAAAAAAPAAAAAAAAAADDDDDDAAAADDDDNLAQPAAPALPATAASPAAAAAAIAPAPAGEISMADLDDLDDEEAQLHPQQQRVAAAAAAGSVRSSSGHGIPAATFYDHNSCDKDGVVASFYGHRNAATVKGVSFFGENDEYIVSGSDCGHVYIWNKHNGELIWCQRGDEDVVNCLEPHPYLPHVLATSGIEDDIKIWAPTASQPAPPNPLTIRKLMSSNKRDRDAGRAVMAQPEQWLMQLLAAQRRRQAARQRALRHFAAAATSPSSSTPTAAAAGTPAQGNISGRDTQVSDNTGNNTDDDNEEGEEDEESFFRVLRPGVVQVRGGNLAAQRRQQRGDDANDSESDNVTNDESEAGVSGADGDGDDRPCYVS